MNDTPDHSTCNRAPNEDFCIHQAEDCPALYDPWEAIGIPLGGYGSNVDDNAIAVLRAIRDGVATGRAGGKYSNYVTNIAAATGLTESHVELWQYIFCSARWCDYGTSPRGCFPDHSVDFDELIRKWEAYYLLRWKEAV